MMQEYSIVQDINTIYGQAKQKSHNLVQWLKSVTRPYKYGIASITESDVLDIRSTMDCTRLVEKANVIAKKACERIAPYTAIPTLFQTINYCYYGPSRESLIWFGLPLKITLAYIADNIYHPPSFRLTDSIEDLKKAILAVILLQQLKIVRVWFEVFGEEGDFIKLGPEGTVEASEHIEEIRVQYQNAFERGGETHRTLAHSIQGIWGQLGTVVDAIESILKGQSPKDQSVFANTIFEDIPDDADPKFWLGLSARLKAALLSLTHSNTIEFEFSISILELVNPSTPSLMSPKQHVTLSDIFWETEWYETRIKDSPDNMIVERPLVQISPDKNLFATSFMAIGESLNWFIESSVMQYQGEGGVRLPNVLFQRLISRPFEDLVNKTFRNHGFLAGSVTEKGIWRTQNGSISLNNTQNRIMPGEIDALAYHKDIGIVFVAECKVLSYPTSINRTRNLLLKLRETDSEGFYNKLQKKIIWLAKTDYFSAIPEDRFFGVIMLDRKMPGMIMREQYQTFDLEILERALNDLTI